MTTHLRCQYVSQENNFECENWFPYDGVGEKLCPVHKGARSISLASNGIHKDEFLNRSREIVKPLIEAIAGMTTGEALTFLDQHIATIEQVIEDKKIEAMNVRALRRSQEEKLNDAERAERRKIRVAKREPVEKKAKKDSAASGLAKEMIAREKTIKSIMNLGKTREQAISLIDG